MKEITNSVPKFIEHCRSYHNSLPSGDVIQDAVENFTLAINGSLSQYAMDK